MWLGRWLAAGATDVWGAARQPITGNIAIANLASNIIKVFASIIVYNLLR
jgi:hypothetical protein